MRDVLLLAITATFGPGHLQAVVPLRDGHGAAIVALRSSLGLDHHARRSRFLDHHIGAADRTHAVTRIRLRKMEIDSLGAVREEENDGQAGHCHGCKQVPYHG